jgi:hypothetical protein
VSKYDLIAQSAKSGIPVRRPCRRCETPYEPSVRDLIKGDYLCAACRSVDNRRDRERRKQKSLSKMLSHA